MNLEAYVLPLKEFFSSHSDVIGGFFKRSEFNHDWKVSGFVPGYLFL